MDAEIIQRRIQGRQRAETLFSLAGLDTEHEDIVKAFWSTLFSMMPESLRGNEARVMGYDDAVKFEKTVIQYGKYQGTKVGDLPVGYIVMLCDGVLDMQAYCRSERFQDRQEREEFP